MSGQNGWYADQQPQYPQYAVIPRQQQYQQQQAQQSHQTHQQLALDNHYMQNGSPAFQSSSAANMPQPVFSGTSNQDQSPRYPYAAAHSVSAASPLASASYASPLGSYGQPQQAQQSPSPGFHPNAARRESTSLRPGSGMAQPQQSSHHLQNSSYSQHHPTQQYMASSSSAFVAAQPPDQAWDYGHMSPAAPHQVPSAGPSQQQQHQHAYTQTLAPPSPASHATPIQELQHTNRPHGYGMESPYAPSTGTRDRLAMSQSPMSDIFQSGGPTLGRTFNMMAGLETPTPAPAPRRSFAQQDTFDSPTQHGGHNAYGRDNSHWNAGPNGNGQQLSPWPAAQQNGSQFEPQKSHRQDARRPSSHASWNPPNAHANAQSRSTPFNVGLHPHPSINSTSPLTSNMFEAEAQSFTGRANQAVASTMSAHGNGASNSMRSVTHSAPRATGSSLDGAWGFPQSHPSLPARTQPSSETMSQSHYLQPVTEPGSPSLSVARNQAPIPRQSAHANPSIRSSSASTTLDTAMSPSPNAVSLLPQPAPAKPVTATSAFSAYPTEQSKPKTAKRKSKSSLTSSSGSVAAPNLSSITDSRTSPVFPMREAPLPQFASPAQLFAATSSLQTLPVAAPAQSSDPSVMRYSEEPQTPPPPMPQMLSVQESPDPLNLLSPHGNFSLWQQPSTTTLPPPTGAANGFSHHRQISQPQHQEFIMARNQAAPIASSSKRKDNVSADKPKRKRVKKAKGDQATPTFDLKADESPNTTPVGDLAISDTPPSIPKKSRKKDASRVKVEISDPTMLPQVTVEIPVFGLGADDELRGHDRHLDHKVSKKKRRKRSRKSVADILNDIVEDSDSGIDAEGSDWDDLDILETWDAPAMTEAETASEVPKNPAKMSNGPVKSSLLKVPLAKLGGFIEDLFEADDSLPDRDSLQDLLPGQSLSSAADPFFELIEQPSSVGGDSRPILVLRAAALQKLLKLVVKCSRPHTEIAALSAKAQPPTYPGLSTIPAPDLTRLLSILERHARVGEHIDPFPSRTVQTAASEPTSPIKSKRGRKAGRPEKSPSKTPEPARTPDGSDNQVNRGPEIAGNEGDDVRGGPDHDSPEHASADAELDKLNAIFAVLDRAVLVTECSLAILTSDILPKQILSEDHICSNIEAVKTCQDKVILPFIEACSGSAATAPHPLLTLLIDVLAPQKARKKKKASGPEEDATSSISIICRNTLSDLFRHLCSAVYLVQRMVRMPSIALSDSIIISVVYLAIGPFFVLEPESVSGSGTSENAKIAARGRSALLALGGANSMKALRQPALNLLQSIFAKAPDQRQWMIEEILSSLSKLTDLKKQRRQYSLRNGKSIHSINALLLQLIQAASHGVASYARSTADRLSRSKEVEDEDGDDTGTGADSERAPMLEAVIDAFNATHPPDRDDAREAEIGIWKRGLEGANQAARSVAAYLMQRIGQTKVAKSSQEMSYAYVVESLVQDLLSALFLPEWPAAALMLNAFCVVFGNYLEDPKSHPDAKGLALEQLSLVAARLRQSQLHLQPASAYKPATTTGEQDGDVQAGDGDVPAPKKPEPVSPSKRPNWTTWDYLSMLRALREGDRRAIQEFVRAYKFISRFLAQAGSEDISTEGALEFLLVQAEGELATAWTMAEEEIQALSNSDDDSAEQIAKLQHFREELDAAILSLSEFDPTQVDTSLAAAMTDERRLEKATDFSEWALTASSSMVSYGTLRDHLLEGLNNSIIANRSKALRGIDRIAQIDPDLFDEDAMRTALEVRLRDSSKEVRETAVGLFGNYLLRKPQHIPKYYQQLSVRVLDTGLAVRKRMVRLLKSIYEITNDQKIRIDSCARIVRCINDEDTSVQEMAALTIGEMWLDMDIDPRRLHTRRRDSPIASTPAATQFLAADEGKDGDAPTPPKPTDDTIMQDDDAQPKDEEPIEQTQMEKKMADTIEIIMAVADIIKERPSPLEEVFRRLFKDKSEREAAELHAKLQKLGDSMIDSLVESTGTSSTDTVKRIRIVQLLVSTNPAILTISKAKLLLPYLKAAQTAEEVQIMDLLLRIFRSCLPHMPKTALAFAQALEQSLRPLVNRPPPKAGLHLLQELIACYCAVVITHTHNFRLLVQTLKACFTRVHQMRVMALKGQKVEDNKGWSTLMSLTASLCEHANFDEIRKNQPGVAPEIDAISKRPLVDVVSEALLAIHNTGSETVRSVALQNLGFIFRAHPTLMTRESFLNMFDDIFARGSLQDRATLLKIFLDFLSADSLRRNPDNAVVSVGTGRRKPENPDAGSVDMTILVGNTESFADTGVGSAIMQRYSKHVLKATQEVTNPSLQRTAIDILRFTVLQGLSHPIECVPYLVSLETLEERKIRSRALELHSHLASKHASLVHARFLDTARQAFNFQLQMSTPQLLRGYRIDSVPTAVFDAWYGLLRDRRATRLDFLKQVVKALDVNTAASDCSMQEVLFARFVADNMATFDYKTMEEVLVVIGELRSTLAVSGMQVLYMIQPHLPQRDALQGSPHATPPPQTPPLQGSTNLGGNLVSPFEPSRNPWLSGEWQLQLASDGASSISGTVDPTQVFDQPLSTPASNGNAGQTNGMPASRPVEGNDDEDGATSSKASFDPVTIARMSVISGTALVLRNHLKHLYGLSEARCAKFNPAKKQSAGADKPATMRALSDPLQAALDLGSVPFGLDEIKDEEDAKMQMLAYAAMVENEGTMMEPEDPDAFDDLAL